MKTSTLIVDALAPSACRGRDDARQNVPMARPALVRSTQADLACELDDADRQLRWTVTWPIPPPSRGRT